MASPASRMTLDSPQGLLASVVESAHALAVHPFGPAPVARAAKLIAARAKIIQGSGANGELEAKEWRIDAQRAIDNALKKCGKLETDSMAASAKPAQSPQKRDRLKAVLGARKLERRRALRSRELEDCKAAFELEKVLVNGSFMKGSADSENRASFPSSHSPNCSSEGLRRQTKDGFSDTTATSDSESNASNDSGELGEASAGSDSILPRLVEDHRSMDGMGVRHSAADRNSKVNTDVRHPETIVDEVLRWVVHLTKETFYVLYGITIILMQLARQYWAALREYSQHNRLR
jgi:hypothetical protein